MSSAFRFFHSNNFRLMRLKSNYEYETTPEGKFLGAIGLNFKWADEIESQLMHLKLYQNYTAVYFTRY